MSSCIEYFVCIVMVLFLECSQKAVLLLCFRPRFYLLLAAIPGLRAVEPLLAWRARARRPAFSKRRLAVPLFSALACKTRGGPLPGDEVGKPSRPGSCLGRVGRNILTPIRATRDGGNRSRLQHR